ncbi:hypothetical protein V1524DRAFT_457723 [Lipomyces starkeyi]
MFSVPSRTIQQQNPAIEAHFRSLTSIIVNGESYALAAPEGSSKYPCPKCDRKTTSLSALKRHLAHNCQEVRQVTRPTAPDAGPDAIPEQETVTAAFNLEGLNSYKPRTLDDIGFSHENTWQVAICDCCHFVVDMPMVIEHLTSVHGLEVPNTNDVLLVLRMHRLRPHLAIIWDDTIEDQLDESDDESQGILGLRVYYLIRQLFDQGLRRSRGIPVQDCGKAKNRMKWTKNENGG